MSMSNTGNKQLPKIPNILYVCSSTLGLLTACTPPFNTPAALGALLGLSGNIMDVGANQKYLPPFDNFLDELIKATNDAIKLSQAEIDVTSCISKEERAAFSNWLLENPVPTSIYSLIEYAEKNIIRSDSSETPRTIQIFDKYFRTQILRSEVLTQLYTLTSQRVSLDKLYVIEALLKDNKTQLGEISKIIASTDQKVSDIQNDVTATKAAAESMKKRFDRFMYLCSRIAYHSSFILISLGVFLLCGLFWNDSYTINTLIVASFAYVLSYVILIATKDNWKNNWYHRFSVKLLITSYGISCIFLPAVCYLVVAEFLNKTLQGFSANTDILIVLFICIGSSVSVIMRLPAIFSDFSIISGSSPTTPK